MKLFLAAILTTLSFSSFANVCTLSIYMPTLEYETKAYKSELFSIIKSKGYKIVEENVGVRADFKGEFLLEYVTEGVFKFQEKAIVSLYKDNKNFYVKFSDSKRTYGSDQADEYMELTRRIPSCAK